MFKKYKNIQTWNNSEKNSFDLHVWQTRRIYLKEHEKID